MEVRFDLCGEASYQSGTMHKPPKTMSLCLAVTVGGPYVIDALWFAGESNTPRPPKAALVMLSTAIGGSVADMSSVP